VTTGPETTARDPLADVAERFTADVAGHEMTIMREDGLYRHLRFRRMVSRKRPTSLYYFDLITWPGHLAIDGDMGGFMFARTEDMFGFFRGSRINPGYSAEKLRGPAAVREYSEEKFGQLLDEYLAEYAKQEPGKAAERKAEFAARVDDCYCEEGARELLRDFEDQGALYGTWEWDLSDWSYPFLWCLHAIQWGIRQYDLSKAPAPVAAWQASPEAQAARKPHGADGEKMAADLASARRAVQLEPAERLAVTVASAQLARGENPPVNTTAALLLTIKRLTGEGQEQEARKGR
jgi:hypothetical protein